VLVQVCIICRYIGVQIFVYVIGSAQSRQEQQRDRVIYSADEQFSVALEYCHE